MGQGGMTVLGTHVRGIVPAPWGPFVSALWASLVSVFLCLSLPPPPHPALFGHPNLNMHDLSVKALKSLKRES